MTHLLPGKHIRQRSTLLGAGAVLLRHLDRPRSVSTLRDETRNSPSMPTFGRMVLALDLLFALGLVTFDDGLVRRAR